MLRLLKRLFGLECSDAKLDAVLNHLKLDAKLVPERYVVEPTTITEEPKP